MCFQAKGKERQWLKNQATGELDDAKIIDGLTGEKTIYKRRGELEPEVCVFVFLCVSIHPSSMLGLLQPLFLHRLQASEESSKHTLNGSHFSLEPHTDHNIYNVLPYFRTKHHIEI